jgi:membrane-associated phospholipid phosphatase
VKTLVVVLCLLSSPALAQDTVSVVGWADAASWGTAFVNPGIATYQAVRSSDPKCRLSQLMISSAIANGVGLSLKHFIRSERPSGGVDGFPSGHSWNSATGSGWNPGVSFLFTVSTAKLRIKANRHTVKQVVAGLALGYGSEILSRKLVNCATD